MRSGLIGVLTEMQGGEISGWLSLVPDSYMSDEFFSVRSYKVATAHTTPSKVRLCAPVPSLTDQIPQKRIQYASKARRRLDRGETRLCRAIGTILPER